MAPKFFQPAERKNEYYTDERCFITELCNTPVAPEGSLAIARVSIGTTTQLHSLDGIDETYIVIEGEGKVEVDGNSFLIAEGDQVAIPSGTPQRVTSIGAVDLRFYCLCTPRFVPETYINLEMARN